MKILVVSNLYPPHHIGGYELGCSDVVMDLKTRGHQVTVLTSDYCKAGVHEADPCIRRILNWQLSGAKGRIQKYKDIAQYILILLLKRPDLVFFWNQSGLCLWLPVVTRALGFRKVFFLSDASFVSWRVGAWLRLSWFVKNPYFGALLKKWGLSWMFMGWPVINKSPCIFVSKYLEEVAITHDLDFDRQFSKVISWGVDPSLFQLKKRREWPPRRFLYVGQISPLKGVHTAIQAFDLLARRPGLESVTLTITGGTVNPNYEQQLKESVYSMGLERRVVFSGKIPRDDLNNVYAEHDVLIFPSEWEEPFAITPLEAMTSGLAVVGTTTGGSKELFRDGENAVTFTAGDPESCMQAILRLAENQDLFKSIILTARREVLEIHTLERFMNRLESAIKR